MRTIEAANAHVAAEPDIAFGVLKNEIHVVGRQPVPHLVVFEIGGLPGSAGAGDGKNEYQDKGSQHRNRHKIKMFWPEPD